MKIHPLINEKSSHYINENGEHSIFQMQKIFTNKQLANWCELNIFKYCARVGKKQGEQEEDNKQKRKTFKYAYMLYDLLDKDISENLREFLEDIKQGKLTEKNARAYLQGEIKETLRDIYYYREPIKDLVKYMLEEE